MKSALAALSLLALVPVTSTAESAYAACMRMGQLSADSADLLARSGNHVPGAYSYRATTYYGGGFGSGYSSAYFDNSYGGSPSGYYNSGFGSLGSSFLASNAWSASQDTRVSNLSRACRHLVRMKPAAYRVLGVKSPAQRTSANLTGRKATPRAGPAFLSPGN